MAFQIKNFVSIVASMLNHVRGTQTRLTDFNIGAVNRTMLEAPAIEMDELYQQMFVGLREAIPVATYNSFNFERLPPVPASGVILVTITPAAADKTIVAGTVFSSPNAKVAYLSQSDVTILAGHTTANVVVTAGVAGSAGNLPATVQFTMAPVVDGFVSAANSGSLINGQDVETDDQRKQRFALFIQTLTRATPTALEYGSRTVVRYNSDGIEVERVRAVKVVEPYETDNLQPVGLVNVYIHNGISATSSDLVTLTAKVLLGYINDVGVKVPGWKAAGVHVVVAAASEVVINVTANLTAAPGYVEADLNAAAKSTIEEYMRSLDIGETFVRSEAIYRVKSIPGVLNITGLPADTTATNSQKIVPGTIAVT